MTDVSEHMVTPSAIAHVIANLRQRDREEIYALRWNDDEGELFTQVRAFAGDLWRVWSYKKEPVAVCGVIPLRPGVVSAASFGTDKWRHVIRPMTTWGMDWLIPTLQNAGFHRGEAYVSATNEQSKRWLATLGAYKEAYLHQFGRNREDYILYAWRLTDVFPNRWRGRWQCNVPGLSDTSLNRTQDAGSGPAT